MSTSDNNDGYRSSPVGETQIRFARSRETTRGADELAVEPLAWRVGDEVDGLVIEKLLGSGVTSTVYRVRDRETGRRFALKILRTRSEETLTASRLGFRRMALLSHPSLVRVDRIIQIGRCIGFTMEEVVGKRLVEVINQTRCEDRSRVFDLAKRLLHDLGGALQTLHDEGLVHRDVKPENVMIDQNGRARLVDYGLVGTYDPVSDPDARRNYLAGTYWYMAPESISMQIYPPACDVYALGCIVLELIAHRSSLPVEIEGASLGQSIGDVRSFLPPDTPAELADLLCDMIDPLPENRPLAARLAQLSDHSFASQETLTNFRRRELRGREKEMAIAEQWVHSVVEGRPTWLHIYGGSGVGKTWFLAELLRRIRRNPWFQVFDSTCRERADVSLQAFDAMADAIARRYSRDDRDPIKLQPRHAILLRQAFPSLRGVIEEPKLSPEDLQDLGVNPDSSQADSQAGDVAGEANRASMAADDVGITAQALARNDALSSGVDLVNRMCDYGPLFLVVDDAQWADQDSINVLDALLANANGEVGIITIGRDREPRFSRAGDVELELKPLSQSESVAFLRELLCKSLFRWDDKALEQLALLGEGNTYRLTQLAACISRDDPAVWQERLLKGEVELEDIWHSRLDSVSSDALVALEYLSVAGGPIRPRELARASELMERSDAALRELIDLQLVHDSPRRDSIEIIHQRLAVRVIDLLSPARHGAIHSAWAAYLMTCEEDQWRAARIAGHLLSAGKREQAVPFVIQAARDASARFAFIEAGRWHQRAAELTIDQDSAQHLTAAIDAFEKAGYARDAARLCRQLLESLSPEDAALRRELHQRLAENLLASGAIAEANQAMAELVRTSSLSTASRDRSPLSELRSFWNTSPVKSLLSSTDAGGDLHGDQPANRNEAADRSPVRHVAAYSDLSRPIALFDVDHSVQCILHSVAYEPESLERRDVAAMATQLAVLGCRQAGRVRKRNTSRLEKLRQIANHSGDMELVWQSSHALALRHLLSCDWASAIAASQAAINASQSHRKLKRFEFAESQLPLVWSCLWLGRLHDLRSATDSLTRQVRDEKDEFARHIASTGLGMVSFLMDDDIAQARTTHSALLRQTRALQSPWLTTFQGLAPIIRWLYQSRTSHAFRYYQAVITQSRLQQVLKKVQLPRVLYLQLEAVMHLRVASTQPVNRLPSIAQAQRVVKQLADEKSPYAKAIAKFFDAQSQELMGERQRCLDLYGEAADAADSLDLVPFRLAATDRIANVEGDKRSSELNRFLVSEGVKRPDKFARLFCGLC